MVSEIGSVSTINCYAVANLLSTAIEIRIINFSKHFSENLEKFFDPAGAIKMMSMAYIFSENKFFMQVILSKLILTN